MPPICDRYMRIGSRLLSAWASLSAPSPLLLDEEDFRTQSSASGGACGSSHTSSPSVWQRRSAGR